MAEYGIIAGIVVITMALVKIIESFVSKTFDDAKDKRMIDCINAINKNVNMSEQRLDNKISTIQTEIQHVASVSKELFDMHNRYDTDGTPIWYVPRSWAENQKEILECLNEVSHCIDQVSRTQERMIVVLDKLFNNLQNTR